MSLFRKWSHEPEGLERAKQASADADKSLREAKATAAWARNALDRNGFAEALILIMRGGTS